MKWEFSHKNLDICSRLLWENVPMGQQSTKPHCVVASPLDQACMPPWCFATVPTIFYYPQAWIPSFMKSVWSTETLELALNLSYCVTFGSPGAIFILLRARVQGNIVVLSQSHLPGYITWPCSLGSCYPLAPHGKGTQWDTAQGPRSPFPSLPFRPSLLLLT